MCSWNAIENTCFSGHLKRDGEEKEIAIEELRRRKISGDSRAKDGGQGVVRKGILLNSISSTSMGAS